MTTSRPSAAQLTEFAVWEAALKGTLTRTVMVEKGRGKKRKTKLVIIIIMELIYFNFMGPSLQA